MIKANEGRRRFKMFEQMDFKELMDCLERSKGHKVETRIRQLELMNHIFINNFNDLNKFFLLVKKEENAIEIINEFFEECTLR